mgnify:CR=1 FL=1
METRIALIGIIVEDMRAADRLNAILHEFAGCIVGRMGIPYHAKDVSIISVVVDAPNNVISSLSGKLGMLPGVSGGVMCVLFGIYQPMMALLSHPGKAFRQYYRLFIPVLIGCAIGFVGLSKVVELAFGADSAIVTCLFFGLILGTIPSLWREAGLKGRNARCGWAFGLSFVILLGLLSLFKFSSAAAIQPNSGWYFFCGAVWGLSLVLPGLSSSSILIFMGLYEPMTAGIGSIATWVKDVFAFWLGKGGAFPSLVQIQWGCILPLLCGILLTALLTARFVNHLLGTHYALVYHVILGVVCASTLMIVPLHYDSVSQGIACAACALAGFATALALDRFGDGVKEKNGV